MVVICSDNMMTMCVIMLVAMMTILVMVSAFISGAAVTDKA